MLYQDDNQTEENATEYTVSGEDGSGLDLNYTTYEEEFRVTTSNNVNSGQNQDWLFPGHMQASSLITEAGTLVTEENKTDQSANLREQLKDFESVILSTRSPDLYKSLTADFSELVSPNSEVDLSRDPLKNILNKSKAIEVHNWTRNISFLISVVTSTARQGNIVKIETRTDVSVDPYEPSYLNETTKNIDHFSTRYDDRVDDKNPNIRIPEEVLSSKYLADGTRTNQTTHKFNNTTRYDDTHHQKNTERFFNTPPENEYRLRSGLLEDSTSFTDPLKTLNPGSYSTSSPPKNFPNTHNLFIDGATTSPTVRTNNSLLTQDSNIKTKKIPINRTSSLEKDKSLNTTPNPTTTFNDTQQSITTVVRIAGVMKLTKGIQWSPNLRRKDTKYYIRLSHTVKELIKNILLHTSLSDRLVDVIIIRFGPGGVVVEFCVELKQARTNDDARLLSDAFNAGLGTNDTLGNYSVDPWFTNFKVLTITRKKQRTGTIKKSLIPQWIIAVIVVATATFVFFCLFVTVTVYGRHYVYRSRFHDEQDDNYQFWQNDDSEGTLHLSNNQKKTRLIQFYHKTLRLK
ncbi:uncharacterized protein LOC143237570 [Tachypleus tridentatus]|uniref:uncharacterized protein LOC143237570 n=1 Tax=Tachypleus tridentatus TaxID=6853 RepID=UPI003FD3639A